MALVKKIMVFLNFAYTLMVLNYSCVGFMVSHLFLSSPPAYLEADIEWWFKLLMHAFFCVGQVLSLHETIASYGSVYYVGTIIPIVLIFLSYVIKPPKPVRPKSHKDE